MKILVFLVFVTVYSAPLGDLYLPDDDVEILNINNFYKIVENSTSAWLVEFYASWCGYCQRFATPWKEFATEVASWRDLVRVGVLECSDEINIPICREFGIVKYPTVRYFHENYQASPENLGVVVPHGNVYSIEDNKKNVVETLIKEIKDGRGKMYPNLLPYTQSDLSEVFTGVDDQIQFIFLIGEASDNYLGAEIAMDLHRTNSVTIRYVPKDNSKFTESLKIEKFPFLVVVDRKNNQKIFTENVNTKLELKKIIEAFLEEKDIKILEEIPQKIQNSTNDRMMDPKEHNRLILRQHIKKMGDVIFQNDLESAIRYSLQQEVATVKVIKDEQLKALNAYLKVLRKYFPWGHNSTSFINQLTNLTTDATEVEGSQIQVLVKQAEDNNLFSSPQRFLGCLGSASRYRGYPCSLWRLFHYLTVNSVFYNINHKKANPKEVLDVMHGYVKNFFSCSHCSEHFQKMAAERNLAAVRSLEESVLWLWETHNFVNNRLKGDETEDPEYPKQQFPTKIRCPECYLEDDSWNKKEVLKYLKRMYGRYNVRFIGTDTNILFPGLD